MEWLKQLLPVLQAGLGVYKSGQFMKKSSENAKAVALQSSAVAAGFIPFVILFTAAVIMAFVDLGNQIESGNGVHFSGMMQSGVYLALFGLLIFGAGCGFAKYLSVQERKKKQEEQRAAGPESPYAPLLIFGEEFLKQVIANLNQTKPPQSPTG